MLLKNTIKNNGQFTTDLSKGDLNKIVGALSKSHNNVVTQGIQKAMGNGVSLDNIVKLAGKYIPQMASALNSITGGHLPKSVLSSSAGDSINKFAQNQSKLAMKKKELKTATEPEPQEQQDAQIQAYAADQAKQAKDLTAYNALLGAQAARASTNTGTNTPSTTTLA